LSSVEALSPHISQWVGGADTGFCLRLVIYFVSFAPKLHIRPQMKPVDINKIIEIPEWDPYSAIKTEEAAFLYDFISEKGIERTLEVGFAIGKSASHIMAATGEEHTAMDPFQDNYRRIGLKNIEKLGFSNRLHFHEDFSHNVLPQLHKEGRKYEFIFIDGDHKFDGILLDFYYADLMLEDGGYALFHDTWMRSTRLVEHFIKKNRADYQYVATPLRNFSLFQKVGEDQRNGMHFREFYTTRSLLSHSMILWMSSGKDSWLKRTFLKIKDAVK
jgi:predicted O-methyltransferase YrrM